MKRFQEISTAYEIVGDKEKRAQYDRGEIDEAGQPKGFNPGAQGHGQGCGGISRSARARVAGGFELDQRAKRRRSPPKTFSPTSLAVWAAAAAGGSAAAQPRKGADIQFQTTVSLEEAALGGTRRVVLGDGRQLEVRIPPGVKDGQQIRLRGQGAARRPRRVRPATR